MKTITQHNKVKDALMYLKELEDCIGDLRQASIDLGWRAANPDPNYDENHTVLDSNEFQSYEKASNEVWDLMFTIKSLLADLGEEDVSDD